MEAKRLILETDAEQMAITLAEAETLRIAAPNLLETAMVSISRRGDEGYARLQKLLERLNIEVVACDTHEPEIKEPP
jgi:uncharacterized protein with PIN domain